MKCKVCGKDIAKHSKSEVIDCLKEAGLSGKYSHPLEAVSEAKVAIAFNYRHSSIKYAGKWFQSKDIELDLYRLCLLGDNVKVKPKVVSKKEDEKDSEDEINSRPKD